MVALCNVLLFVLLTLLSSTVCFCVNASENCGAMESSVARAREIVRGSGLELSQTELDAVMRRCPKLNIYRIMGEYADYRFEWSVGGMQVVVFGNGNLSKLDGAQVLKTKKDE